MLSVKKYGRKNSRSKRTLPFSASRIVRLMLVSGASGNAAIAEDDDSVREELNAK
jgi:hypothetical protein